MLKRRQKQPEGEKEDGLGDSAAEIAFQTKCLSIRIKIYIITIFWLGQFNRGYYSLGTTMKENT